MEVTKKVWKAVVERKRTAREALLPPQWLIPADELPTEEVYDVTNLCAEKEWLTPEELNITTKTITALAALIAVGRVSALEVVSAFAHRATIAQQLLNPLTEINFEEALAEAERLDKHMKETGKVVGPLHGIPFSVKDEFDVKGLDTTMGYCSWEGRTSKDDWSVVATLRKAGAVNLCKTNVGHSLMISETINHLWGRTLNPFNRSLTTGASSGGEGALIGFHGSPLGFGTDIGGSIRVPAAFCGLYSLRPSHGRMSMRSVADPLQGQEAVRSTPGPMAHSPEDLELVMKTYLLSEPWRSDPAVLKLPWTPFSQPKGQFCFAIAYGDELVTPHPATIRGLRHVAEKLKSVGHIVVEWQGPFHVETTMDLVCGFWAADGGISITKDVEASGEPMYPDVAATIGHSPDNPQKPPSVYETWAMQHKRTKHVEWWSDNWEATANYTPNGLPIDGLITATGPYTAWRHRIDVGKDIPWWDHAYCYEQPILDLASGSFPTGLCQDPEIDLASADFKPRSKLDAEVNSGYVPEEWRNGPIGLQITARRLEEEKVVDMLCKVKDALAQ